ncbi:hypothetical protein T10_12358 [Trichinella papuae]|uniref:Uncharacterized protein n=1 Tax=Trichinella papuae TaxID=268474 RepID=A0A0V1N7K6_9BILA|nr:hypothetical protein T10_12358 [Trichinella papuae]
MTHEQICPVYCKPVNMMIVVGVDVQSLSSEDVRTSALVGKDCLLAKRELFLAVRVSIATRPR